MPNTPFQKIVTASQGRGAELKYGPGNNQYARASDVNPVIDGVNALNFSNATNNQVTQLTSNITGVTLNATTGVITMYLTSLTAGSSATFTMTNSNIISTSVVIATATCATASTAFVVGINPASAGGSATVSVSNISGTASGTSNPIKIYFTIL